MDLTSGRRRNLWWYIKFVFACQAAGLALWMLTAIAAMPFVGFKLFDMYSGESRHLLLPFWVVCVPVVWRYLR
jgi:hypothetical protein